MDALKGSYTNVRNENLEPYLVKAGKMINQTIKSKLFLDVIRTNEHMAMVLNISRISVYSLPKKLRKTKIVFQSTRIK